MKYFILCLCIAFVFSFAVTEDFAQIHEKSRLVNNKNLSKINHNKKSNSNGEVEQEWVAIYNGVGGLRSDEASDIAVDSSGNVYVTGYSQGLSYDYDCATIKYDAHGEALWIRRYDGGYDDYAYKLALGDSGNVYITGSSESLSTGKDCLTIKYNTEGVEQWVRKYNGPGNGDDNANYIAIDDSGNVYVTGYSKGAGTNMDYITIKYNSQGIEQWIRTYNGIYNSYDEAVAIVIDSSGNIFVTGSSIGLNNRDNYLTIKYNAEGVEKWVRRYVGTGGYADNAYDIAVDGFGNVYVTGGSPDSNSVFSDYFTLKYDSSGTQLWTARYNGTGNSSDLAYKVVTDIWGNVYVTGFSLGEGERSDCATLKYDFSGNQLWASRFNGGIVYDLAIDNIGNAYVTGVSFDSTTIGASTTIKYDTYGVQQWFIRYNGPGGFDEAKAIALDESANIYVGGITYVQGGIPTFDYATIKYKQRIVPVELTNFTASVTNNHILLEWETATETNNSGFEIQRHVVSKQSAVSNWNAIGFVPGYGTTVEPKSYTFIDRDVSYGVYHYRLKQIDFDGSFEYSNIVKVLVSNPMAFSLEQNFPNPFNSVTTINFSITEPSYVVLKVYNTLGEEVEVLINEVKVAGKYEVSFKASSIASGVYIYRLNVNEYVNVKKMVLLR